MRLAALIRCGKLCERCSAKKCHDNAGVEIECPTCRGAGCEHCQNGYWMVNGCPQDHIRQLYTAIRLADLFSKGLLPVAGGVLDQAASFIEFARQLEYEDNLAKRNDG